MCAQSTNLEPVSDFDKNSLSSNEEIKYKYPIDMQSKNKIYKKQNRNVKIDILPPDEIILRLYRNSFPHVLYLESICRKYQKSSESRFYTDYKNLKLYYGMIFVDLIKNFENYYPEKRNLFASIEKNATPLKNFLIRLQMLKFFESFQIYADKSLKMYFIIFRNIAGLSVEILDVLDKLEGNCPLHYILKVFMYQEYPQYHGVCHPPEKDQIDPYFLSTFSKQDKKTNDRIKDLDSNKRNLFPNRDLMMYREDFATNLKDFSNPENEVRLCENFYDEEKLLCDSLEKGMCPMFLYVNHKHGKKYRSSNCRGNYIKSDIY